jgi:hypothetical protein
VIPAEGAECGLSMRVSRADKGAVTVKTVNIKVVGKDGKYLDTVRLAKDNDIAAINVTPKWHRAGCRWISCPRVCSAPRKDLRAATSRWSVTKFT